MRQHILHRARRPHIKVGHQKYVEKPYFQVAFCTIVRRARLRIWL